MPDFFSLNLNILVGNFNCKEFNKNVKKLYQNETIRLLQKPPGTLVLQGKLCPHSVWFIFDCKGNIRIKAKYLSTTMHSRILFPYNCNLLYYFEVLSVGMVSTI